MQGTPAWFQSLWDAPGWELQTQQKRSQDPTFWFIRVFRREVTGQKGAWLRVCQAVKLWRATLSAGSLPRDPRKSSGQTCHRPNGTHVAAIGLTVPEVTGCSRDSRSRPAVCGTGFFVNWVFSAWSLFSQFCQEVAASWADIEGASGAYCSKGLSGNFFVNLKKKKC